MKLPSKAKLEKVCGKNDTRYYLNAPYLDVAKKRVVASNGKALVVHPVELDEGDTSGAVPLDAIKAARSKTGDGTVALAGDARAAGIAFPRPDHSHYPDVDKVIPTKLDTPPTVRLDVRLLLDLAEAIGEGSILSLWVGKDGDAVRVEAARGGSGAFGVILPCRW